MNIFAHDFMRDAFLAGTPIAAAAGLVGYFLVMRSQVFASDALGHVAYTGALAALAFGVDARLGLFAATVVLAVLLGTMGRRSRPDDVVIGSLFAWVLGLGVLALTVYTKSHSAGNGSASANYLFGSIFGLSADHAYEAAAVSVAACIALIAIARPLLYSTVDEAVAVARGVPVRILGIVLLVLTAITTAVSTQAVGALLSLGLIAAPAGAAARLVSRPYGALLLSAVLAVVALWLGLIISYFAPTVPPSFAILAVASTVYGLSWIPIGVLRRGLRLPIAGSAN